MALGIIARKLLARTPCPMLMVSPECEAHLLSAGLWRKVLAEYQPPARGAEIGAILAPFVARRAGEGGAPPVS